MAKNLLMYSVMVVLGVLVWLDHEQKDTPSVEIETQRSPTERADLVPVGEPAELLNPLSALSKAELSDTVERPLFAPARKRPPEISHDPAPIAQVEPKPEVPSYDLVGVVRDGDRAIALIRDKKEGSSFRVEVGDMIGGWRVAKLKPKSILLERADGTSRYVTLF